MMPKILLNMNLTASVICAAVFLLRLLMKKLPAKFSYALWSIPLVRLMLPITLASAVSVFNFIKPAVPDEIFEAVPPAEAVTAESPEVIYDMPAENVPEDSRTVTYTIYNSISPDDVPQYDNDENIPKEKTYDDTAAQPVKKSCDTFTDAFMIIWISGILVITAYSALSVRRLKKILADAENLRDNIFISGRIDTPFVFGIAKPKIYIPRGIPEEDLQYILAHEKVHIRRHDNFIKPFAFAVISVHWFNPVLWLSFRAMESDMERSCDEEAVSGFPGDVRRPYASALLNISMRQNNLGGARLVSFGENSVRSRIKNVLSGKRHGIIASVTAAVIVVSAAACLLTDAKEVHEYIVDDDITDCALTMSGAPGGSGAVNLAADEKQELIGMINSFDMTETTADAYPAFDYSIPRMNIELYNFGTENAGMYYTLEFISPACADNENYPEAENYLNILRIMRRENPPLENGSQFSEHYYVLRDRDYSKIIKKIAGYIEPFPAGNYVNISFPDIKAAVSDTDGGKKFDITKNGAALLSFTADRSSAYGLRLSSGDISADANGDSAFRVRTGENSDIDIRGIFIADEYTNQPSFIANKYNLNISEAYDKIISEKITPEPLDGKMISSQVTNAQIFMTNTENYIKQEYFTQPYLAEDIHSLLNSLDSAASVGKGFLNGMDMPPSFDGFSTINIHLDKSDGGFYDIVTLNPMYTEDILTEEEIRRGKTVYKKCIVVTDAVSDNDGEKKNTFVYSLGDDDYSHFVGTIAGYVNPFPGGIYKYYYDGEDTRELQLTETAAGKNIKYIVNGVNVREFDTVISRACGFVLTDGNNIRAEYYGNGRIDIITDDESSGIFVHENNFIPRKKEETDIKRGSLTFPGGTSEEYIVYYGENFYNEDILICQEYLNDLWNYAYTGADFSDDKNTSRLAGKYKNILNEIYSGDNKPTRTETVMLGILVTDAGNGGTGIFIPNYSVVLWSENGIELTELYHSVYFEMSGEKGGRKISEIYLLDGKFGDLAEKSGADIKERDFSAADPEKLLRYISESVFTADDISVSAPDAADVSENAQKASVLPETAAMSFNETPYAPNYDEDEFIIVNYLSDIWNYMAGNGEFRPENYISGRSGLKIADALRSYADNRLAGGNIEKIEITDCRILPKADDIYTCVYDIVPYSDGRPAGAENGYGGYYTYFEFTGETGSRSIKMTYPLWGMWQDIVIRSGGVPDNYFSGADADEFVKNAHDADNMNPFTMYDVNAAAERTRSYFSAEETAERERIEEQRLEQKRIRESLKDNEICKADLSIAEKYLTEYWENYFGFGELSPEKYIDDEKMLGIAYAQKKKMSGNLRTETALRVELTDIGVDFINSGNEYADGFFLGCDVSLMKGKTESEKLYNTGSFFEFEGDAGNRRIKLALADIYGENEQYLTASGAALHSDDFSEFDADLYIKYLSSEDSPRKLIKSGGAEEHGDRWFITMSMKNVTDAGAEIIISRLPYKSRNSSPAECVTGEYYRIEKYSYFRNEWEPLGFSEPDKTISWSAEAYCIKPGEELSLEINRADIFGGLTPGKYRVVKEVSETAGVQRTVYEYYCEFEI